MDIITQEERERLIALGYKGMMKEISEGKHCHPTSAYRDVIDALLASVKSSEDESALTRVEAREEKSLSISRKALRTSESANKIAIIAIMLSIITTIVVTVIQLK